MMTYRIHLAVIPTWLFFYFSSCFTILHRFFLFCHFGVESSVSFLLGVWHSNAELFFLFRFIYSYITLRMLAPGTATTKAFMLYLYCSRLLLDFVMIHVAYRSHIYACLYADESIKDECFAFGCQLWWRINRRHRLCKCVETGPSSPSNGTLMSICPAS